MKLRRTLLVWEPGVVGFYFFFFFFFFCLVMVNEIRKLGLAPVNLSNRVLHYLFFFFGISIILL